MSAFAHILSRRRTPLNLPFHRQRVFCGHPFIASISPVKGGLAGHPFMENNGRCCDRSETLLLRPIASKPSSSPLAIARLTVRIETPAPFAKVEVCRRIATSGSRLR